MEIKWSKLALNQLDKALNLIIEEGYASYAEKLELRIVLRVESLFKNHALYPVDKYRRDDDGTYHAF